MPTERFMRLPKEKIEAIRAAAAKEFMRIAPEEVSINRIVHDADISRGSFYTYFEDKQDLLKWLICNQAEQHFTSYITMLDENGGDLWEVLEQIFDLGMDRLEDSGLSAIFHNLVNSARLVELFKGGPDSNPEAMEANRKFLKLLYEHVNKEKCDLDHQEFFELIEMHMIVFIMSLKRFFRDGESRTEASEYYKRHIHMLHYGICGYKTEGSRKKTDEGRS